MMTVNVAPKLVTVHTQAWGGAYRYIVVRVSTGEVVARSAYTYGKRSEARAAGEDWARGFGYIVR